ncbi:ComEA family DNA-binding protein [Pseudomonas sp. SWRI51]|uniref:ComEA family DNA-binding protein n=1 Tax=Pseudomonas TaxID=286 RepID=UPI001645AB66|nr:ComEA family DNA-binding protein [Pseudomonas sp. SWRI51]MBC3410840.1 ComEA family DNA-binding protein [Pseudomonas sp. SWRI51]
MRNTLIASFLFPLIASFSLSATAAQAATALPVASMQQPAITAMAAQAELIPLNQADAQTLQGGLNGIGHAKAQAIVAYREANGPFTSVDELLEVKGIGKALLDRNRDRLTVE